MANKWVLIHIMWIYIILRKKEAINLNPWAAITHHTSQHSECPVLLCAPLTIPPSPTKTLFSLSSSSFLPLSFFQSICISVCQPLVPTSLKSYMPPFISPIRFIDSFSYTSYFLSSVFLIRLASKETLCIFVWSFVLRVRTILIRPNNLNCRSKDCHFSHLIFFVLAFN